jgi:hypothetical protein
VVRHPHLVRQLPILGHMPREFLQTRRQQIYHRRTSRQKGKPVQYKGNLPEEADHPGSTAPSPLQSSGSFAWEMKFTRLATAG